MDKKFLYLVGSGLALVVVLVVVLIALNNRKPNTPTSTQTGKSFTVWDYNNEKAAYDPIITTFQSEKKIKVEYVSKDISTYYEDAINAIAAGKGPDVWIIPNNMVAKYQDKLVAMPANKIAQPKNMKSDLEVYKDLFPPVVNQDNIINNKIYGMPLSMNTLKLYVNWGILSDVLNSYHQANPGQNTSSVNQLLQQGPKTWDDFTQIVKLVTKKSGSAISQPAVALGTANNINLAPDILTLMMLQDGTKMVSDDSTTAQFHTAQNLFSNVNYPGTQALKFYTSFADPKNPNYTWSSTMPEAVRAFANNQVAMIFAYKPVEAQIKLINAQAQFGVLDVPQINETTHPINFASYDTLVVTRSAGDPSLAWDFVLMAANSNMTSSYRSISRKDSALNQNIADSVKTAVSWYNPDPDQVGPIFRNIIQQANDGKDAQTALDGAAGQVTTLLGKLIQNNK